MKNIKSFLPRGNLGYVALTAAVLGCSTIYFIDFKAKEAERKEVGEKVKIVYSSLMNNHHEAKPTNTKPEDDSGLRLTKDGTENAYRVRAWRSGTDTSSTREWWNEENAQKNALEVLIFNTNPKFRDIAIAILDINANGLDSEDETMNGDYTGFWKHPRESFGTLPAYKQQEYAKLYKEYILDLETKVKK